MSNLILKYKLKTGVTKAEFESWVLTTDYVKMRSLERVVSFKTYRTESLLLGEGAPSVEYVEVFEIADLQDFISEDMPGPVVQGVMGQFMQFAESPEFIIASEID